jgi:hypothetical protein
MPVKSGDAIVFNKKFFDTLRKEPEKFKERLESHADDEYKIYYELNDTVYNGWGDWRGHDRVNRKGYWATIGELLNIDTVTYEEIRYYLNNRLYRESYLQIMPFLKRVYLYKKQEYDEETPFVKLVMGKSGITDEKTVRDALTWWKIKNKWKRWHKTDDAKAYRMIMKKLAGTVQDVSEV